MPGKKVALAVKVGLGVKVWVDVGVCVGVAVLVGVDEGVKVPVGVWVDVPVAVAVWVCVGVDVDVPVAVAVGVFVGGAATYSTSTDRIWMSPCEALIVHVRHPAGTFSGKELKPGSECGLDVPRYHCAVAPQAERWTTPAPYSKAAIVSK